MIRTQPGQFRAIYGSLGSQAPDVNLIDSQALEQTATVGGTPSWTPGATLIDQINNLNTTRPVKILGYSIQALLFTGTNQTPAYGKWGDIVAGITDQAPSLPVPAITPTQIFAWQPLPVNTINLADLWTPDSEAAPTLIGTGATNPGLPISCNVTLPQPLNVQSMSSINVGIWMKRSLLHCNQNAIIVNYPLVLSNAGYTIVYDDMRGSWEEGISG